MQLRRNDVLEGAIAILDEYGLADLTMRRLASSLGVQPGALYWHFPNKQRLLAAVTDAILAGVCSCPAEYGHADPAPDDPASLRPASDAETPWDRRLRALAHQVRDGLLSRRDGAEVATASYSARLASNAPRRAIAAACRDAGLADDQARMAADALFFSVLGQTMDEQSRMQMDSHGALADVASPISESPSAADRFDFGLELFIDGVRGRLPAAERGI